jgi:N-acyl-D-amino-acid deacylase
MAGNILPSFVNRRVFLARSSALSALMLGGFNSMPSLFLGKGVLPIGEAFDSEMERFMSARKVPGGALAVVKDRRLVYARGYGWADRAREEPVKAKSLFRIASLSKPVTSAAIMRLVDSGKLSLDKRVADIVPVEPVVPEGQLVDPRLQEITIRQLLQHTGGWNRDVSGDPMFRSVQIARAVGVPAPARPEAIIRYMFGQPLDFAPGALYAYSNFGYCLLGRVIEKVTGLGYEDYVRQEVLGRMGIRQMRLGKTLARERAPGEVRYYTPGDGKGNSVFRAEPGRVPVPYGTFCLEAMDAHGGWLASAVDLARFAAAMDAPDSKNLLKPETRSLNYQPPAAPVSRNDEGKLADHYYGAGWSVRPVGNKGRANYWHTGSLPGTFTLLVRRHDGLSWAVLFNQRSEDSKLPDGAIDGAMHRAADAVAEWPDHDLFETH